MKHALILAIALIGLSSCTLTGQGQGNVVVDKKQPAISMSGSVTGALSNTGLTNDIQNIVNDSLKAAASGSTAQ